VTYEGAFLPYGRQQIEADDIAAVAAVLRGEWLTTGPKVAEFEREFAAATGARHAVAVNSGTAALHLAARAVGLSPGCWAVVPTITFLATANAVRFVGADVVFADVDPETGLLGPAQFEAALARAPGPVTAVFSVHLGGQCVGMDAIAAIARSRGIAVIEDACHALGTTECGAPVGSCRVSDVACFSLHPVKTIAAGEGGIVTTNDEALAATMRRQRNHGMVREPADFHNRDLAFAADGTPNPWYYEMVEAGFNYRLSDINCALALSQLGKLERFASRRQALARLYDELLAELAPLVRPVPRVPGCRPVLHLYQVLIDFDAIRLDRADLIRALSDRGIGTQVHYIPVHRQPYYKALYGDLYLPGADAFYRRTLSLPLFSGMTEADVVRVVTALKTIIGAAT